MSELVEYLEIAKRINNSIRPEFSTVFEFPYTNDYVEWVNQKLQHSPKERKPKNFWNDVFGEIIERQVKHTGVIIPDEWYEKLISYKTMSVYLIGDDKEELLYIGKGEFPPIIGILNRMVPKEHNPNNNTPEIWDSILSKGKRVKCAYVYNLDGDPEILKSSLLNQYRDEYGRLPLYNKRSPAHV